MKNWILIDDKKFEIFGSNLVGEYGNNSNYVRAFRRHFERHTLNDPKGTYYEHIFGEKSDVKNKIRILIRFEDLDLPIWEKTLKQNSLLKLTEHTFQVVLMSFQ